MPKKADKPFLIAPDDPVEVVERKLQQRFGEKRNANFSIGSSTSPAVRTGRPYADRRTAAYEHYCALRAAGKQEKVAAAEVASMLGKSDDAVVKAMRVYDDAQTDEFWTAMMQNDVKAAAVAFCSLDAHIRLRIAKHLRRHRK